jgi:hypothetical protein
LGGLELEDAIAGAQLKIERQGAQQVLQGLIDPLLVPQLAQAPSHAIWPRQQRSTSAAWRVRRRRGRWNSPAPTVGFLPLGVDSVTR